ncbi:MAG: hypothetical protein J0L70_27775 [Leptolyngbya sp. UWPOB_LEPTO1]|uniref:hypothetical protein n=1 Tax=Leptolyngbya sp. UWPOB_LEPTO1 TaxID=2815653 RepID=UPI001AC0293E|nr:hypothetical protein [Leptolyngbya sp. UWPOB_LEPTO1]MBN8564338.1 hypothetical protein [Leptolyngbya sp. UWPOB_LEPTO1]
MSISEEKRVTGDFVFDSLRDRCQKHTAIQMRAIVQEPLDKRSLCHFNNHKIADGTKAFPSARDYEVIMLAISIYFIRLCLQIELT